MPRIAREKLETCFYHVIVQGIAKEYIFEEEEDIKTYIYLIKKYCDTHKVKIIAYCMMNNHGHFLLYTEDSRELSKAMQRLNITYGKYYNKKNKRIGYVFRDRFLSEPIRTERQLLNCIVYIHNNPVKAHMVEEINKYKYSSYNEYIKGEGIATKDIIKLVFGTLLEYIEQFKKIHNNYEEDEFMEAFAEKEDKYKEIIKKYLEKQRTTIEEIATNKDKVKEFLREVRDKRGVPNRRLAEILKIGRETLRKL